MRRWLLVVVACTGAGASCVDLDSLGNGPPRDGGITTSDDAPSDAPPTNPTEGGSDGATTDGDARSDAGADPDLLGAWDFDGTGDTAPDVTGNGHDGSLVGVATQEPGGIRGGSLVLHGLDLLRIDSLSAAAFPKSGTLALWVRVDAPVTGPIQYVVDSHDPDRPHFFLRRLQDGGSWQAAMQDGDGGQPYVWFAAFPIPSASWVAVALTWSETDSKAVLFVDKKLYVMGNYSVPFAPTEQSFVFGRDFVGRFDEIRLWKRVLTAAEIAALP
jgi:hypothetical protein